MSTSISIHGFVDILLECYFSIILGLVTTTNTVLCTILNLLNNRACVQKMYTEIMSVLGNDRTATSKDIKTMHYCQAVVMETQRYSTLVPLVSHLW